MLIAQKFFILHDEESHVEVTNVLEISRKDELWKSYLFCDYK